MSLPYAVERLYEMGWLPAEVAAAELERLEDGRLYPALFAVVEHFSRAGLKLAVKPNLIFNCYQASWCPAGEEADPAATDAAADDRHGTVIATSEREAAVYALAQLLAAQAELSLATA